jgi:hypothetical protein
MEKDPRMDITPPAQDSRQQQILLQKYSLEQNIKRNLNWFYWIGGMSILNSIISATGSGISFVIGLGLTQVIDAIASGVAADLGSGGFIIQIFGWMFDLVIAGFYLLEGALAKKRIKWLIILGMVFYALDAALLLYFQDYLSALFHGLGLFGIFKGLQLIGTLKKLEQQPAQHAPLSYSAQPGVYPSTGTAIPVISEPQKSKKDFWLLVGITCAVVFGGLCLFLVMFFFMANTMQ